MSCMLRRMSALQFLSGDPLKFFFSTTEFRLCTVIVLFRIFYLRRKSEEHKIQAGFDYISVIKNSDGAGVGRTMAKSFAALLRGELL